MSENLGENDFERRLFAMLESGDAQFPKGARRFGDFEALPVSVSVWDWLRRSKPRLVMSVALAYAAALVVSAPVYLALFPRAEPRVPAAAAPAAPPPAAVGSAARLDLGAGPVRAGGTESRLSISRGEDFVVLSFLVPIQSDPHARYAATLADGGGRVLVAQQPVHSVDELGNFVLVCRSDLFTSGGYVLTIQETSSSPAAALQTPRRFAFHVSRARD